ncbi:MAG TPA: DUF6603 domain-containing protein [Jatrophihabitans sp.]|jgi:hypothetical protein|uniref:DUF6603 domain-containing protein n=1 Tax=Jatrophihabitans sp. TaxID=1932789 RepID=UPI002EE244BE
MADGPGRQLLDLLQRELVLALHAAVADIAGSLDVLEVDDAFNLTPFVGRVLAAVQPDNAVLSALSGLTGSDGGAGSVNLHGWRDEAVDAAPRGLAYVARSDAGAIAALTVVPAAGVRLTLRAVGLAGQGLALPLSNGFSLNLSGNIAGEVEIGFTPDQPPQLVRLAEGDRVEVSFTRGGPGTVLGIEGGPSVRSGTVTAGGWVATRDGKFDRGGQLQLSGGEVRLLPGFVKGLLPVDLMFPLEADLRHAGDGGVTLAGSPSLRTRLSGSDTGRWLDLTVEVTDSPAGPALRVGFLTSLDVSLPGAPVDVHIDGVGFGMPIALKLGAPMLPSPGDLQSLEPTGAAVSLTLPVVNGSGMLSSVGNDLAGGLSVRIPPLSAAAFGLLSPARDGEPLSFLVIMGATFPPPGVQVGFGFAISGVGGVVGINRRIDRDALLRAVTDGTAAQLLFPSDPAAAGPAAMRALPAIFPAARGSIVAGPMFQLSWGGRIVTLSVAVLLEASTQARMTILGKLVVALPDPEAPLVFLQATFAGVIDPAEPSVMFVASLTGSHIVGVALAGDILMLSRGGSDPQMVLSAGGFHPAYRIPRGVPALRRMSMDLSPVSWLELRCENYFAITSNSMQLGARLELVAEVAGCGLRGHFAYDALVQYSPFKFIADVSGGVALRAFGETLVGVSLALHLEGPAPYLARGRGSIDLFFFEVSFDFELGWGSPPPALDPPPDVGAAIRQAVSEPAAWRSRGTPPPNLLLTRAAQKSLEAATVVDPYAAVSVRQQRVPLGLEIGLFEGIPVPSQRWDIQGAEFGPGEPADHTAELRAEFAPGQFVAARSDDQALTAAAFLPLRAGIELYPAPAAGAQERAVELVWEECVIARDVPKPIRASTGIFADLGSLELLLTALSAADGGWWAAPDQVVTVDPVAPVATAFALSMTAGPDLGAVTGLELAQEIAGSSTLMTVEAWEL